MAWTNPRTWSVREILTSALMNQQVRDNLLETAPAKITAAGDLVVGVAANAIARLARGGAGALLRMNGAGSTPEWTPAPSEGSILRVTPGVPNWLPAPAGGGGLLYAHDYGATRLPEWVSPPASGYLLISGNPPTWGRGGGGAVLHMNTAGNAIQWTGTAPEGALLRVTPGVPSWLSPPASGGSVLYAHDHGASRLPQWASPPGTGYLLISGNPPVWSRGPANTRLQTNAAGNGLEWAPIPGGGESIIAVQEQTTSTAYTDLPTVGPTVTLAPGGTRNQLVIATTVHRTNAGGSFTLASISVAGAAPTDTEAVQGDVPYWVTGSRPIMTFRGDTTYQLKYRVNSNTGYFTQRRLTGIVL